MKWQNADFLRSSSHLRNSLSAIRAQSAKGLLPLQETVLSTIDPILDETFLTPALAITDPRSPEWKFLGYFGVSMEANIHYYLRCLIAVSEKQAPDFDIVAYLYEQVQARYKGCEDLVRYAAQQCTTQFTPHANLVRAAFFDKTIIHVPSNSLRAESSAGWLTMEECISKDIDIELEYPGSAYLFRSLIDPRGDAIAALVARATLITSSTKLEDISRLFKDVSTALKDINISKIALLLKPLQHKRIFPITNGVDDETYEDLQDVHNNTWYIADQSDLRESFYGKLPLLAFTTEDIAAMEDMFRVLRLDSRRLSKRTQCRTIPKGRVTVHWPYTESLRDKCGFLTA
jgi:hypothetical protein